MGTQEAVKIALSAKEAAQATGQSVDTIYNLIRSNAIAAKRSGTKYLIEPAELQRWFDALPEA